MIVAQFPPSLPTDYPNNINTTIRFENEQYQYPIDYYLLECKPWRVQIQDLAASLFSFPTSH